MNDRQLECFLAAAKTLNFTDAARELYTTQPTISRLISTLEEELGFPLFYRTNKEVRLTAPGVLMYQHFSDWRDSFQTQLTRAQNINCGMDGSLKIGFAMEADLDILWDRQIPAFQKEYPNIVLSYEGTHPRDVCQKLEQGIFDLAFEVRREQLDTVKFCSDTILSTQMFLACSKTHPLAKTGTLDPDILKNTPIWTTFTEKRQNNLIKDFYHDIGVASWDIRYVEDFKTALVNVRMGNGILFIDPVTKKMDKDHFALFLLPQEYAKIYFSVVWARANTNPALPMFLEFMEGNLVEMDKWNKHCY